MVCVNGAGEDVLDTLRPRGRDTVISDQTRPTAILVYALARFLRRYEPVKQRDFR